MTRVAWVLLVCALCSGTAAAQPAMAQPASTSPASVTSAAGEWMVGIRIGAFNEWRQGFFDFEVGIHPSVELDVGHRVGRDSMVGLAGTVLPEQHAENLKTPYPAYPGPVYEANQQSISIFFERRWRLLVASAKVGGAHEHLGGDHYYQLPNTQYVASREVFTRFGIVGALGLRAVVWEGPVAIELGLEAGAIRFGHGSRSEGGASKEPANNTESAKLVALQVAVRRGF